MNEGRCVAKVCAEGSGGGKGRGSSLTNTSVRHVFCDLDDL